MRTNLLKPALWIVATIAVASELVALQSTHTDAVRTNAFETRIGAVIALATAAPHSADTLAAAGRLDVKLVEGQGGVQYLIFFADDAEVCASGLQALGPNFDTVIVSGEVARTRMSLTEACQIGAKPRIVARLKSTMHPPSGPAIASRL